MNETIPGEVVIVRRRAAWEGEEVPHGVWKIAYADFMTAMMAFFLVMWLINVTDDSVRRGVAQYFNPVKLASTAPNKKGLNDPSVIGDTNENGANQPDGELSAGKGQREGISKIDGTGSDRSTTGEIATRGQFEQTFSETILFSDPYSVLDQLAAHSAEQAGNRKPDARRLSVQGEGREAGARGGAAFRDPFDPLYWQVLPTRGAGEADATADNANLKTKNVTVMEPRTGVDDGLKGSAGKTETTAMSTVSRAASKTVAVAQTSENPAPRPKPFDKKADGKTSPELVETRLRKALAAASGTNLGQTAKRVEVRRTGEGVLVSLTDDQAFGMFAIGSAEPRPELVSLLARIGKVLAREKGPIVIKGHTDARPFRSKSYDNWRLSSARAQMALYMLVRGGVPMTRFERVEGYADRDLKNAKQPFAAVNRRIEILLRDDA
jgi:chemotaxis protein MotB